MQRIIPRVTTTTVTTTAIHPTPTTHPQGRIVGLLALSNFEVTIGLNLQMRPRISIRGCVRPSVCPCVHQSVHPLVRNALVKITVNGLMHVQDASYALRRVYGLIPSFLGRNEAQQKWQTFFKFKNSSPYSFTNIIKIISGTL